MGAGPGGVDLQRVQRDVGRPAYVHAQPSEHLTWEELRCHDGIWLPLRFESRAIVLAHEFELIRTAAGGWPITVLSGYRTPEHNARVGGVPTSQHLVGRALDLKGPWQIGNLRDFQAIVRRVALEPGSHLGGVGYYAWGCHIDIRPRPNARLVEWHGSGPHPAWHGQDL